MNDANFNGVEDTLFIPLVARIEISKKFPEYFYDAKALSIEHMLPSKRIAEKSSEYAMMASVSRCFVVDNIVSDFITKNETVNVVAIGCGLDTMSWRLEKNAHFYQLDFPSVIERRKQILGVREHEIFIEGNVNELDLSTYMDSTLPTIFALTGVFHYFKEHEVFTLIKKLQGQFSNAQILFDATDEFGLNYAKRYVKKTGNRGVMMYFFIKDPEEFAKKANTRLLSVCGFYNEARKKLKRKLKLSTRMAMKLTDDKRHAMILNLKL